MGLHTGRMAKPRIVFIPPKDSKEPLSKFIKAHVTTAFPERSCTSRQPGRRSYFIVRTVVILKVWKRIISFIAYKFNINWIAVSGLRTENIFQNLPIEAAPALKQSFLRPRTVTLHLFAHSKASNRILSSNLLTKVSVNLLLTDSRIHRLKKGRRNELTLDVTAYIWALDEYFLTDLVQNNWSNLEINYS